MCSGGRGRGKGLREKGRGGGKERREGEEGRSSKHKIG